MTRRERKKIGPRKAEIPLFVAQEVVRRITNWKSARIKSYGLKARECGRALYKLGGSKALSKGLRARILNKFLNPVLGNKRNSQVPAVLRKFTNSLPINYCVESSRTTAISAVKEILENVAKAGLISALVDSGVASVEAAYLVSRGRITKRDAFRHVIKEASGGATSGIAGIGTVAILTALSSIPVVGRVAILTGVNIAVKKLRNRL